MSKYFRNLALWILFTSIVPCAQATSVLKNVQITGGNEVTLQFDSKLNKNQIKTEFFRDIIQVSIKDGSVYPAKISSVETGELTKVFAYQYTPNLIRARLSIKGNAEDYQTRISVSVNGSDVSLKIKPHSLATPAIAPNSQSPAPAAPALSTSLTKPAAQNESEKNLLEQIIKGTPSEKKVENKLGAKGDTLSLTQAGAISSKQLTGQKVDILGKFARIFIFGSIFLGLLAVAFLLLKRNKSKRVSGRGGLLSQIASKLGKTPENRAMKIDVIANHYLGPKKSIAVVRVKEKTLVLGITDDSINLITQMNDFEPLSDEFDESTSRFLADSTARTRPQSGASSKDSSNVKAEPDDFSSLLGVESAAADHFGVRSRIKKKVESLKQI